MSKVFTNMLLRIFLVIASVYSLYTNLKYQYLKFIIIKRSTATRFHIVYYRVYILKSTHFDQWTLKQLFQR